MKKLVITLLAFVLALVFLTSAAAYGYEYNPSHFNYFATAYHRAPVYTMPYYGYGGYAAYQQPSYYQNGYSGYSNAYYYSQPLTYNAAVQRTYFDRLRTSYWFYPGRYNPSIYWNGYCDLC